jgi:hypothetical protein
MNKISVILAGMLALAGTVALATTPGGGGSSSGGGGGGYSGGGGGSSGGGGGGSSGGGGGGSHGGGGGGSSGGGGAHGGGGYAGGYGGGGTHSAAAAAGWAHSGGASGTRGFASGAVSAPHMAAELHSHAAARAVEMANHRPHPPLPTRPAHPHGSRYERVAHFRPCDGNIDCALWSGPDLYCADYPSDYLPTANGSKRCPHPRRTEIDQRTGLPVP